MPSRQKVAVVVTALGLTAGSASAAPGTPPPDVQGTSSEPPAAWFHAGTGDRWFAYGSFCWSTACVDFLPPGRRTDLPKLVAAVGDTVGIHLRFAPTSVRVQVLSTGRSYPLVAARDTRWRVRGSGVVIVEGHSRTGPTWLTPDG